MADRREILKFVGYTGLGIASAVGAAAALEASKQPAAIVSKSDGVMPSGSPIGNINIKIDVVAPKPSEAVVSPTPSDAAAETDNSALVDQVVAALKAQGQNPDASAPAASVAPDASPSLAPETGIKVGTVTFIGTPESVDSSRVDTAKGMFKNTIGKGTEMAFAEPGGLLVGPDYGYTGDGNPFGTNREGWLKMYKADGNIQVFSPVTQEVLHYEGPAYQNVPEGGWMIISAGQMHAKIGNYEVDLPFVENNNYLFVVRGMYGDMQQNTDRNTTAELTNYKPGHALVMELESGSKANVGFLSEGQLEQMAVTSHSGGTNLGDAGASRLTLVILDLNTGAQAVLRQDQGRNGDGSKNWVAVGSNW